MPTARYKITCDDVFTYVVTTPEALEQIFQIEMSPPAKVTTTWLGMQVTIEVDMPSSRVHEVPVRPRGQPPGGIEAMPRRSRMAAALATGQKGLSEAGDE